MKILVTGGARCIGSNQSCLGRGDRNVELINRGLACLEVIAFYKSWLTIDGLKCIGQ